jgi:DNA invertase Pin-like site-specific DNA recombinase
MKTIGYIRVSTDEQDTKNQRHEILGHAHDKGIKVDEFISVEISSRKSQAKRRIDELWAKLESGDILIISELSRIGRSTAEVINLVNDLVERKVRFIALKQNIDINGTKDTTAKVMITMFSLFAELERDLISDRTRHALSARKAAGVILGRPKGSMGKNMLDEKRTEIEHLLSLNVSKASIAKICGVKRSTLLYYIGSRKLEHDRHQQKTNQSRNHPSVT